jgi:hypothetical protein
VAFATLEDVKGKLGIAASDASRDDALVLVLDATCERLEDLTRYSADKISGRQDVFRDVQATRTIALTRRPIAVVNGVPTVTVEGRPLGAAASWSTLAADVVDAEKGELVLLGFQAWWPPSQFRRPRSARWREYAWDVVRVTYDVAGQGDAGAAAPKLIDVNAAWAAYLYQRHLAGAREQQAIGPIREVLMSESLPGFVAAAVAALDSGEMATWV